MVRGRPKVGADLRVLTCAIAPFLRYKASEPAVKKHPTGRYGGQRRDVAYQVWLLQSCNHSEPAIPKSDFVRLVKDR